MPGKLTTAELAERIGEYEGSGRTLDDLIEFIPAPALSVEGLGEDLAVVDDANVLAQKLFGMTPEQFKTLPLGVESFIEPALREQHIGWRKGFDATGERYKELQRPGKQFLPMVHPVTGEIIPANIAILRVNGNWAIVVISPQAETAALLEELAEARDREHDAAEEAKAALATADAAEARAVRVEKESTRKDLVNFAWVLALLYFLILSGVVVLIAFGHKTGMPDSAVAVVSSLGSSALTALYSPVSDIVRAMIRRYSPDEVGTAARSDILDP